MQVGKDIVTSAKFNSPLWFGFDKQLSALVLKFNFIFLISSGYGRTEFQFSSCIKPCPLDEILFWFMEFGEEKIYGFTKDVKAKLDEAALQLNVKVSTLNEKDGLDFVLISMRNLTIIHRYFSND